MKYIQLTQGKKATVDDEDFEYLSQFKWSYAGGYAIRGIPTKDRDPKHPRRHIWMHRVVNQTPEGFDTDHINRNTLDNRKSNLRTVTRSYNNFNQNIRVNNTSGHKGVCLHKQTKMWMAYIHIDKKSKYLGYYSKYIDAVKARELAEKNMGVYY